MKTLTTVEAADRLGVTPRRVRALIQSEQLPAEKKGRDYLIDEKNLKLVLDRNAGRVPDKDDEMKNRHKVFIAIPFDAATRNQYKKICESQEFKDKYPGVTWVIAAEQIRPSPELSKIETFNTKSGCASAIHPSDPRLRHCDCRLDS